jgi:hypothetical protein
MNDRRRVSGESYRDLVQIPGQMGVAVAPCTILRRVVRYSPDFAECWRHLEKPVGRSWRKLAHVEKQLRTGSSISEELTRRLAE